LLLRSRYMTAAPRSLWAPSMISWATLRVSWGAMVFNRNGMDSAFVFAVPTAGLAGAQTRYAGAHAPPPVPVLASPHETANAHHRSIFSRPVGQHASGMPPGLTLFACSQFVPEVNCTDSAPAQQSTLGGVASCTDNCCRLHDTCCGHANSTRGCNSQMVDCLSACGSTPDCVGPSNITVGAPTIKLVIEAVIDDCCGHPCSQGDTPQ
jgi:hypothetical protein